MRILGIAVLALIAVTATGFLWRGGTRRAEPRSRWLLGLRLAAVIFLVVALAEPYWRMIRTRIAIVCLVDVSDSIRGDADALTPYLRSLPDDSEVAIAAFAETPTVLHGFTKPSILASSPSLFDDSSSPNPPFRSALVGEGRLGGNSTNLGDALAFAADLLPPDGDRRILLLTDGAETRRRASDVIPRLRAEGIAVTVVPSPTDGGGMDTRVLSVALPASARPNEPVSLTALLNSSTETDARILLRVGDESPTVFTRHLTAGRQSVEFPLRFSKLGETTVTLQMETPGDSQPENNRGVAVTEVRGGIRCLYVASAPTAAQSALTGTPGVEWTRTGPRSFPSDAALLSGVDAVVFDDVSADALTDAQMNALAAYVRESGGGWLTIGGANTYGAGDWRKTPLEETAPVRMEPQEKKEPLALLLALDKSGSMAHQSGTTQKLELAVRAASAALDALDDEDRVAVLAFDAKPSLVVPLTPKSERAAILRTVGELKPGSGTDILKALRKAGEELDKVDFPRKHVILMSDGQSEGDMPAVARSLADRRITVSAIAVGADAKPVLGEIAKAGQGSLYRLKDARRLPRIFAAETRKKGKLVVQERTPIQVGIPDPIVAGTFAPLDGYVAATPKESARVFLKTPENDPLLVGWQAGAGKSLAFLSDGGNRWTTTWTRSVDFSARWQGWLRWVMRSQDSGAFDVLTEVRGSELRVRVDVPSPLMDSSSSSSLLVGEGRGGGLTIRVLPPHSSPLPRGERRQGDGFPQEEREKALEAVNDGYEARLPLDAAGVYDVRVAGPSGVIARRKIAYRDNAEFVTDPNPATLTALAAETGGAVSPDLKTWARPRSAGIPRERPLSGFCLAAAIVLVVFELVLRRFGWIRVWRERREIVSPLSGLRAVKARFSSTVAISSTAVWTPTESPAGLSRLRTAKQRVITRRSEGDASR